jgi:hypothetical protein
MKVFKPEDFEPSCGLGDPNKIWPSDAATRANQKLEGLKKYEIKAYSFGREFISIVYAYKRPLVLTISEVDEGCEDFETGSEPE